MEINVYAEGIHCASQCATSLWTVYAVIAAGKRGEEVLYLVETRDEIPVVST